MGASIPASAGKPSESVPQGKLRGYPTGSGEEAKEEAEGHCTCNVLNSKGTEDQQSIREDTNNDDIERSKWAYEKVRNQSSDSASPVHHRYLRLK